MALKQVTLYILMLILATAQSLRLVKFGRSGNHPGDNRILLECQRSNTLAVPNPQIFVERSDLARQPVRIAGNEAGQVSIIITQELEGWYSCSDGHNRSTNMLALVAYPQPNPSISSFYSSQAGLPVTVNCRVIPGKLSQYYQVRWWIGRSTIATSLSSQYQLHDNFSLTIKSAQPSDSSTKYRCSVIIDDPQITGTNNVFYDKNYLPYINVIVYERPTIRTHLQSSTVVVEGRNMTLSCAASGGPGLTLSWHHNGVNLTQAGSTDNGKYRITKNGNTTTMLTMNQVGSTDSGRIECIAMVTVFVENSQTPTRFTASTSTSLSILAGDFDLDVDITTTGDTLFQLILLVPIPGTVQLRIKYISQENPDSTEQHMRRSNGAYTNVSRITADVPSSDVPYQRFKVQVALMIDNQQGPFVPESLDSAQIYDKSEPTQADNTQTIIIAAVAGSLGLLLIIAAVVIGVLVFICCMGPCVARDKGISDKRVEEYWKFLLKLLRPKRTQPDSDEELDEETQQQLSKLLTDIIQKNKMIGPEIIKIVENVMRNNLTDGSVGQDSQERAGVHKAEVEMAKL